MSVPSLLRLAEHEALSSITLSGRVLDLGGDKNSEYIHFFQGTFQTTTLNISDSAQADIMHNLEKPLPIEDGSYEHIILINVLEHVFAYRELLQETMRVLKPKGSLVVVVPFLFPVHPSPEDYHRFTASALKKELALVGYEDIYMRSLGSGVWSACYVLIDRLLPKFFRFILFYTFRFIAYAFDAIYIWTTHLLGKKYQKGDYALGYCVVARKI